MVQFPATFETDRLIARLPRLSDVQPLFAAYMQDARVTRYLIWTPHESMAETQQFIADSMAAAEAGTRYPYVLARKERPEEPIGMLDARPGGHKVSLGYVLAQREWGQGLMPEAVSAFTDWALAQPTIFRVAAFCDIENLGSQRTLEKAGFLREGRLERYSVHPNLGPEPRPCYMYARCK